jgi:D-alanyl-D-alanine carboxypeptidase/D-alanyl-D-alanine-endopeptidase (penicillin-binding protein 4)
MLRRNLLRSNLLRRKPLVWFVLALALLQALPAPAQMGAERTLRQRVEAVLNAPDYQQATWALLVLDSKTGEVVFEHNADRLVLPASVTKLFSVAAALVQLGADFVFETPVYRRGQVKDGVLEGDLVLVAQGDLTLGGRDNGKGGLAFKDHDHTYAGPVGAPAELTDTDPLAGLKDLARQVRKSGITHVKGDVLIDDRLFDRAQSTGSGPKELSPIVVNDNVVDVIVTPGAKVGEPATVKMRPETEYVRMDASVQTVAADAKTKIDVIPLGGERFAVRGTIALKSPPVVRIYGVEHPAGFARALFIETLRGEGVQVDANPLVPPRVDLPEKDGYGRLERVALHKSAPFSEVAKVTLKVSHNLYASTLPLLLAARHGKRTLNDGLKIQGETLAKLGVDVKTISFAGGAGGAGADHVTARATVQLLQAMAARPDFNFYEAALPVLGTDGTLSDVGADSPARGAVRAKTGTYYWYDALNDRFLLTAKALAGYMTTSRGRRLTFALFVNNVPLPPGTGPAREGRVLGQLAEIFHQHAP